VRRLCRNLECSSAGQWAGVTLDNWFMMTGAEGLSSCSDLDLVVF
jgi:hypothetical protein